MGTHEYDLDGLAVHAELPRYAEWVMSDFRPYLRGRVIDVGAGIGTTARRYLDRVDEAVLVEPATDVCARLAHELRAYPNVHAIHGTLQDVFGKTIDGVTVAEGSFDAAVMVNVLEHIEEDEEVLRLLHRLLAPGGALLLFVPATPFLYGPTMSASVRCAGIRAARSPVVESAGFRMTSIRYFDLLGMVPWLITGRVLRRPTVSAGSALFYDRFVVPLCKLVDAASRPRVGKNLVCIAQSREAPSGSAKLFRVFRNRRPNPRVRPYEPPCEAPPPSPARSPRSRCPPSSSPRRVTPRVTRSGRRSPRRRTSPSHLRRARPTPRSRRRGRGSPSA